MVPAEAPVRAARRRSGARRGHRGLSRGGAGAAFVTLSLLLGGIANAVPPLTGLVGFLVLLVGVLCWLAAGSSRY